MIIIDVTECFYSENKGTYLYAFDNRKYLLVIILEQLKSEIGMENFFRMNR